MLAFVQAISTSAPCFNLAFLTLKALFAFIFTQSTFPAEHYCGKGLNGAPHQDRASKSRGCGGWAGIHPQRLAALWVQFNMARESP
jgi:hypothetical protein